MRISDWSSDVCSSDLVNHPGGIIILEMGNRDNALSHIAHIVEAENTQILSSYVRMFADSSRLEVTIKVNTADVSSIVAAFLRHDYTVKSTYNDENSRDNSRDRYEQLMNYKIGRARLNSSH